MEFGSVLQKNDEARVELCQRFLAMVRERVPGAELEETGPMQFRVTGPGLKESTVYLENLFRQLSQLNPDERDDLVSQHVEAVVSTGEPAGSPIRPEQIVGMIKDQVYLDQFAASVSLVSEHFVADLWIVYAVDQPTRMMTLQPEQLESLGLAVQDLRALARENLATLLPDPELDGESPWYLVTAGSDYTASLLLLDEVWEQFADEVEGDLVVAVPTRDCLLMTGSASAQGIAAVRARARDLAEGGSYAVSETLLRPRNGRWTAFS